MNITIRNETDADIAAIDAVTISAFLNAAHTSGALGWFGLGPISVIREHQRRGVGSRLMREALRILREQGAAGCVLLGEPSYYSRFGFQVDPNLVLPNAPPEYFQAVSFSSSRARGNVSYHPAFNA